MQYIKYQKGKERCKCGGTVMYDGFAKKQIPYGFGDIDGKFEVVFKKIKGWVGNCMTCRKRIMAYTSVRVIKKEIKVNNSTVFQEAP